MARVPITKDVQNAVLTGSARRCALCFGLDGVLSRVDGQIAHVDRNHANAKFENLAFLCLAHHDEYDSRPSQSKGIQPGELTHYRDRLYEAVASGAHLKLAPDESSGAGLEHDRAAFAAADAVMSEASLRDVLGRLSRDHSYDSRGDILEAFVEHFRLGSNAFVSPALQAAAEKVAGAIANLDGFIANHFFTLRHQRAGGPYGTRICLYPDLNVDRGGTGAASEMAEYSKHAKALHELVDEVEAAYSEYRAGVKRQLLV